MQGNNASIGNYLYSRLFLSRNLLSITTYKRVFYVTVIKATNHNKETVFLLNIYLSPANSDESDENISPMKIIHYIVLLIGANFSSFSILFLVINFGNFPNSIFYYKN